MENCTNLLSIINEHPVDNKKLINKKKILDFSINHINKKINNFLLRINCDYECMLCHEGDDCDLKIIKTIKVLNEIKNTYIIDPFITECYNYCYEFYFNFDIKHDINYNEEVKSLLNQCFLKKKYFENFYKSILTIESSCIQFDILYDKKYINDNPIICVSEVIGHLSEYHIDTNSANDKKKLSKSLSVFISYNINGLLTYKNYIDDILNNYTGHDVIDKKKQYFTNFSIDKLIKLISSFVLYNNNFILTEDNVIDFISIHIFHERYNDIYSQILNSDNKINALKKYIYNIIDEEYLLFDKYFKSIQLLQQDDKSIYLLIDMFDNNNPVNADYEIVINKTIWFVLLNDY